MNVIFRPARVFRRRRRRRLVGVNIIWKKKKNRTCTYDYTFRLIFFENFKHDSSKKKNKKYARNVRFVSRELLL